MAAEKVQITIPFEVLVDAINSLSLEDKIRIWDMLEEQMIELEEKNPAIRAQIEQALADYQAGDYVTLEEYLAEQHED